MTLMPGYPCSPTDVLHLDLDLPQNWWAPLQRAVAVIPATHTKSGRIRKVFGDRVAETPDLADAIRSHIQPILDTVAAPGSGTN